LGVSLSLAFSLLSFLLAIYHGGFVVDKNEYFAGGAMMHGPVMGQSLNWSGALTMDGRMPWLFLETASTLLLFISLGRWLEARAKTSTASALHQLLALKPVEARVMDFKVVDCSEFRVGNL